ncbi:potassium-transporting ATPase subunit F [Dolichospermum sp. ST_sed3]|nr:potassium-transporting ATPase subunit F [Dolichospermum sp. ST_sed6]MDD1440562.1 potassium-transporting ATPase subunit F [Dolichospermum sp. ST_sed3]MDD1449242.1 potassium-transporting ATPase subunit F [Dolichospermum sp. ST_sed8]MDD1458109.1 potassium-transporting ATPase subunit F [Dolichospermum sp. ST_sed7]MDD1474597.1 potassium-transporting ATPase subunit F [Dolichospermum sp. ST_sed4]
MIPLIRLFKFKSQLPLTILMVMCLNLFITPLVYANTGISLDKVSTWAIGVLGFITLMLVFYLLIVIFQPERF